MVGDVLVPKLVLAPAGEKRLLPESADGDVEVWHGNDGYEAFGYAAGGRMWAYLPGTAAFSFLAGESSVVAFPDSEARPSLVEDAYFRTVLPLVLQLRGHEVLHASAVSGERGLAVLCGVSGMGKSTFAFRLSQRGYPVWADDAVALDIDGGIAAFQVPFRLGLDAREDDHVHEVGGRVRGEASLSRSPVLALLILEQAVAPDAPLVDITRLEPASAFTALLPHAYYYRLSDPDRNTALVSRYLQLAASIPTFGVRYRPGLGHIDAVLDEIEEHVMGGVA